MTAARVLTRAVLVVHGTPRHLPEVLDCLERQSVMPDIVDIVTDTDLTVTVPEALRAQVHRVDPGSYRDMLMQHLDAHPALGGEYLWLVHDDSAPFPDVLEELTAAARKRPRAAIVGASQVEWSRPEVLINVGSTASRWGARRVSLNALGDVNQGQYHSRDDVLAVSLAGALVRRDAFYHVGGLEPAYGGYGEGLELGRRCWNAGYDVIVVPQARVRHAQTTWRGTRADAPPRWRRLVRARAGEWFHAMVWGPGWAVPLWVVWSFLAVIGRVIVRIAHNSPGLAIAELAVPWAVLSTLGKVRPARRVIARTRARRARTWAGLLASPLTVLRYVRTRYFGLREYQRSLERPPEVVAAELERVRTSSRWMLIIAMGVSALVSALIMGSSLVNVVRGGALGREGWGIATLDRSLAWSTWWHGWSDQDLGGPLLDGGYSGLMAALAAVPGPTSLAVAGVLVAAAPGATLAAWMAVGTVNRSGWVRMFAAVGYGCWPWLLEAVGSMSLGTVIIHTLVPWVVWGAIRAVGHHAGTVAGDGHEYPLRRPASASAAMGAAVALSVVVAIAPVLLVIAIALVVAAMPWLGRRWWRPIPIVIPAVVVAMPTILAVARAQWWSADAAWIGLRQGGVMPGDASVVFTHALAAPDGDLLGLALVATVVIVAAFAMVGILAANVGRQAAVGLMMAGLGAAVAIIGMRVSGDQMATVQPAVGLSVAWLGLLLAAATTLKRVSQPRPAPGAHGSLTASAALSRRARTAAVIAGAAMTVGLVAQGVVVVTSLRPEMVRATVHEATVLPLLASLEISGDTSGRVVVLGDGPLPDQVNATIATTDGTSMLLDGPHRHPDGRWWAAPEASGSSRAFVDQAVAAVVAGDRRAPARLALWGVAAVVVAPESPVVGAAVEQQEGLGLVGASDRGTTWAVSTPQATAPSRAWLEATDGTTQQLENVRGRITDQAVQGPGTLIIAVPQTGNWRALSGDQEFMPVADRYGRAAFEIPAGDWDLSARYDDAEYRFWRWAAIVAVAWAAIGMVPLRAPWRGRAQ